MIKLDTAGLRPQRHIMMTFLLSLVMALASCGGEDGAGAKAAIVSVPAAKTPTDAPAPTPPQTPAPTPTSSAPPKVSPATSSELIQPIASNFERAPFLANNRYATASSAPDVVGAFRFLCGPGDVKRFDPIVYPGEDKTGHLHQFFGNTATSPDSTYESLRTTGDSTCQNKLNRSAYWVPALMNGEGQAIRPRHASIYYKRRPASDPFCTQASKKGCVGQPHGIKYIIGYDMLGGETTGGPYINCKGDKYADFDEMIAHCGDITEFKLIVNSLDCWDGKHLDTPDHRAHISGMIRGRETNYQSQCPDGYDYIIPRFTLSIAYILPPGTDVTKLSLASDHHAGTKPGGSFHADLWDAWDAPTKKNWTENCLDRMLNCSDGNLGDGTIMARGPYYPTDNYKVLVPVPE